MTDEPHRKEALGNETLANEALGYVRAALTLQGYRFDESQIAEIALQFSRIAAIAKTVDDFELPFESEPGPVYRP